MTVVVCVTASEGIVVASDSRRMRLGGGPDPAYEIASETARKLFVVGERVVVATYGWAMIGDETVGEVMDRFADSADAGPRAYAEALGACFADELSAATEPRRGDLFRADGLQWPIGFVVTGYEEGVGLAFGVRVRPGDHRVEQLDQSTSNPGVLPLGQIDAIERLLNGVEKRALRDAKIKITDEDRPKLDLLYYDLILPQRVDEAVDLARFLITTQLGAQRFSYGTHAVGRRIPGCGGSIRVASVSAEAASWIAGQPPEQAARRNVA